MIMNTPTPGTKETHKILRLIGALIIAIGSMLLLNQLIGPQMPAGTVRDGNYQRMQLPETTQPARLIET